MRRLALRRISVDLTPLLPGGANGGAKLVARALVRELSLLLPETEFLLLTSAVSHAELEDLDAHNVRRQCVDADLMPESVQTGAVGGARFIARLVLDTLLPVDARTRVKDQVWTMVKRYRREGVASQTVADLLLCPFTAPFYFEARVPLVSIIHDLQFVDHPHFFKDDEREGRLAHFRDACAKADRIVCVSEFVRQTVLRHSLLKPVSVEVIHSAVLHATAGTQDSATVAEQLLNRLGLASKRFLLYPANAWPHKNHKRLVEAFATYVGRCPDTDLALLCSGAPSRAFEELQALAAGTLPPGAFVFAGFLPELEFEAVLRHCRALIFPSLYEGFGLPVLEAMACGRPVLCSNATSLPEVAGDAALLFDPTDSTAIADAIERLESSAELEQTLVQRGRARVEQFGSARDMAVRYLRLFETVVAERRRSGRAAR